MRSVHADAVGVGGFTDWLEKRGATGRAVAAAAGSEAECLGPVIERAAGVARLGTNGGLDQAADGAVLTAAVADRGAQRGDRSCVRPGGRAFARDLLTDESVRDREPAWVRQRRVGVADQRVVIAREALVDGRADQRGLRRVGIPGCRDLPAMPGGEEVVGASADRVEAQRATVP